MRKPRPQDTWTVLATFRPGDKGTKRLVRDWGEQLVCVRYRYNSQRKMRVKTAEIVVDEAAWKRRGSQEVGVEIRSWEKELRHAIARAGGRWDGDRRIWVLEQAKVRRLGLEGRAKRLSVVPPFPRQPLPTSTGLSKANILGNQKAYRNGNFRSQASNPGNRS